MREILAKAIQGLKLTRASQNTNEEAIILPNEKRQMRKIIAKERFQEIQYADKEAKPSTIIFIDGGNAEIIGSSTFSVQKIRIATVIYGKTRRKSEKQTFYCLAQIRPAQENEPNRMHQIDITTQPAQEFLKNPFDSSRMLPDNEDSNPENTCGTMRRLAEIQAAISNAQQDKDSIIVLDGTLKHTNEFEKKLIDELESQSKKTNSTILAISKTTTIFTDAGRPAPIAIDEKAKECQKNPPWMLDFGQAGSQTGICFAKLHRKSQYVLRIDYFTSQSKGLASAMQSLISLSKDPTMPGYPYGLIQADSEARITDQERKAQRNQAMILSGKDKGLLEMASKSKDAHRILDRMQF